MNNYEDVPVRRLEPDRAYTRQHVGGTRRPPRWRARYRSGGRIVVRLWHPIPDQEVVADLRQLGFEDRRGGLEFIGPSTPRSIAICKQLRSSGAVRKLTTISGQAHGRGTRETFR